jgi:outer membrane protein OmpA-like peptidoglycan-associated protein
MLCLQVVAQNTEVKNLGNSTARASESAYSYARDAATTSFEISISFANNSAKLDASYRDNAIAMQELESFVRSQLREENGTRAIIVEGAASPIGKEEYNKRLALRRAQVVRDFLHTIEGGDRIVIHAVSSGEDWESFARDVLANYNRSNRAEVVEIIR